MFNIASAAAIDKQENDIAGRRIAGCVLARLETNVIMIMVAIVIWIFMRGRYRMLKPRKIWPNRSPPPGGRWYRL